MAPKCLVQRNSDKKPTGSSTARTLGLQFTSHGRGRGCLLPQNKTEDLFGLEAFADDNLNVAKTIESDFDWVENIVG